MSYPAWDKMTEAQKLDFLNEWLTNTQRAIQGLALQLEDVRGRLSKAEAAIAAKPKV